MTASYPPLVFTPAEVAGILRVTPETIRRKIVAGELGAIEVGGKDRKQYRITATDLSKWLGPERATQLFSIGRGLQALEQAFAAHPPEVVEEAIAEAVKAVKAQRQPSPLPADLRPTPTLET